MARLLAAHLMLFSLLIPAVGQDDTAAKLPPTIQIDASDLKVPDGDVQEMIAFLRKTTNLQQQLNREYRDAMSRINIALMDAGKGVLQNPEELSDEDFESAASIALTPRVRAIAKAEESEKRAVFELVKRQLSIAIPRGVGSKELSNASTLAIYLDRSDDNELALLAYQTFAELFRQSGDDKLKPLAERFEGSARRLGLLGNSLEVTGKLVDGSEFEWNKYLGKVVLVDFWATWCGPCIAEASNVRKNYDEYHDLGFEVVGISLDTNKNALESYLKNKEVPWVNLFKDGVGWKHPMAVKYGVSAIPTVFLVDREGKVVSLRARGSELGKQLKELLGTKEDWERAIATYNDEITDATTDVALLKKRARAYSATEQWDLANTDWLRVTELDGESSLEALKQFRTAERWNDAIVFGKLWIDQKPEDPMRWYSSAPSVVMAGDKDAYRDFCVEMLNRVPEPETVHSARAIIKSCLLMPDVVDLEELPIQDVFKEKDMEKSDWTWSARGLIAYRAGDYKSALKYLETSNSTAKISPRAMNLALIALAQHQLGDEAAARKALGEALKLLDTRETPDVIAQILYREAIAEIGER